MTTNLTGVGDSKSKEVRVVASGKPVVAIVGRQNVGKSTLLNRVVGRQMAIVSDLPGTTRDRILADVSWRGAGFVLIDTGGLEPESDSDITQRVKEQVETAIAEADAIVFLVDTKDGLTFADLDIADKLRQTSKPLLLVANKVDNDKLGNQAAEFYRLGLGEPLEISAYHNRNIDEFLDKISSLVPAPSTAQAEPEMMKAAIVGRTNVGKSMLLNQLLGENRVIVADTPGTTRDAIDSLLDFGGQNVLLIDTAGIKRRGRRGVGVERYSAIRALRAIERADVAILVIDASQLLAAQDMHIAGYIEQAVKGIVLVVNKWDLVTEESQAKYTEYIRRRLKFMTYAPVVYTSAKFGWGTDKVVPQAFEVYQERLRRISTAEINRVVQEAVVRHRPPQAGKKRLKILYATQTGVNPPTFVFFVNDERLIHFSYRRYLENKLRQAFNFNGTPFRLVFKSRGK